jgi:hypothetical protein
MINTLASVYGFKFCRQTDKALISHELALNQSKTCLQANKKISPTGLNIF